MNRLLPDFREDSRKWSSGLQFLLPTGTVHGFAFHHFASAEPNWRFFESTRILWHAHPWLYW